MKAGYDTPETAARGDTPERYSRALACSRSPDDQHAFVLLGTNEPPDLHPYLVVCHRGEDGWVDGNSANADMWFPTPSDDGDSDRGGLAVWNQAPEGAQSVQLRFRGVDHRIPTVDGYYLFVAWDTPQDVPRPALVGSLP